MSLASRLNAGPDEAAILAAFGVDPSRLLGGGGESRVFALDDRRVLRVFHPSEHRRDDAGNRLLASWVGIDVGVAVPAVLDAGRTGSQDWTVDVRIPGRALTHFLRSTSDDGHRRRALLAALEVTTRLQRLPIPAGGLRHLLGSGVTHATLAGLLAERMAVSMPQRPLLAPLVPDWRRRMDALTEALASRAVPEPRFVHLDVFPGNILSEGPVVTGVCDVGAHALAADPVLDLVGLAAMLPDYQQAEADSRWLDGVLTDQLGPDAWLVDAYRAFYGFYYSMDTSLLDWAALQVRRIG